MDLKMKQKKIEELVELLNRASAAYYGGEDEILTNYEWDSKFDELKALEDETGIILDNSPTQTAGAEVTDGRREKHEFPALSLKKDKNIESLKKWAGSRLVWLSWKLDGITLVATYDDGELAKLLTRGNGIIGKNITNIAPYICGLPQKINYGGHMVVRGEALISYERFEYINSLLDGMEYKNPRNLVSGTLDVDMERAEDIVAREVHFRPFTLVYCDEKIVSWGKRMDFLTKLGFEVVEHELTDAEKLEETIAEWTDRVGSYGYPVDGLVIAYDDTEYATQGTVTGHHANNAGMAYKWEDTVAETVLDHIEWSCATNVISPVAVFKTVELEGTHVSRASLCNISEMKRLGIGADGVTKLSIIKANKIIPKCISADACGTSFDIPDKCPVCGEPTKITVSGKMNTETLCCTNPKCAAKGIKKFARFASRAGLDIDGISIMTVKAFMNMGFIRHFEDLYSLGEHEDSIVNMDGFGRKSFTNLMKSLEKSRKCSYINFLYSLSIPMIGEDAAKKILNTIGSEEFDRRISCGGQFTDIDGIGAEKSKNIVGWFADADNMETYRRLHEMLEIEPHIPVKADGKCSGMSFVITGKLTEHKNRKELVTYIESQGGKTADSVSKNTDYLINNDIESMSSKNKTAKSLGIPIITEADFLDKFGNREN